MLDQSTTQQWQQLQILRHRQLRARPPTSRSHTILIHLQDIHQLVDHRVPRVLDLVGHGALDGLVREEGEDGVLVGRGVDFGETGGGGVGAGGDSDSSFAYNRPHTSVLRTRLGLVRPLTVTSGMQHRSLQYHHRLRERVLELQLDGIRLVDRHGRQREEVC